MENIFADLEPGQFLVAVSGNSRELCAFSVVGHKPGLEGDVYTQLLSAVSPPWRGKGIYGGFADLLVRDFPGDSDLLNVTHTQNRSIRKAYSGSGRRHIADTVITRRVFEG